MVGSEASRILLQQKTPEGPPKQYGIRKPLSQAGPTEADVQRTKELEKFLLDVELYKSTKKAVKKEELLCQLNQIYLGSWDCKINLWQTNDLEIGGELVSIKKRKKGNEIDEPQVEGKATSTLVRHAQCVSFVVRLERGTIFSTSCDHSVRKWDVETGQETSNMFAKCECCRLIEECTEAYITRVPERFQGHWICGPCVETMKDEVMRSDIRIGNEKALNKHMSFCKKYRSFQATSKSN